MATIALKGGDKKQGQGPTPDDGGVKDTNDPALKQATVFAELVPLRWKMTCPTVFDFKSKPVFPLEAFRSCVYSLLADTTQHDDRKILLGVLTGDKDHQQYAMLFLQAEQMVAGDKGHVDAIDAAIKDVAGGGDMAFNTRDVLGNYAMLSQLGKAWIKNSPLTKRLAAYRNDGTARRDGAKLASLSLKPDDDLDVVLPRGGSDRVRGVDRIQDLLANGALGISADNALAVAMPKVPVVDKKGDGKDDNKGKDAKAPDATAVGPDGKPVPAKDDPNKVAADELIKNIKLVLDKKGDATVSQNYFQPLLKELEAAPDPVKDLVYKQKELVDALVQHADPKQAKQIMATLDTVEGLYTACLADQMQHPEQANQGYAAIPGSISPKAKALVFQFLAARPGPQNAEARGRVLQHAQLKLVVIDRMVDEDRIRIYRLIATGEDKPSTAEQVRKAAEDGRGADAARLLMKLANSEPTALDALKEDHIFRQSLEKLDAEIVVDGFPVNPLHLCLTMWGLKPMSTEDPGGGARQTEIDPDGTNRPLTIDERVKLESELLIPTATSLRAIIHKTIVWDSDMVAALQSFETLAAKEPFVKLVRRLGKGSGTLLMEKYQQLYPDHDLRLECQKYVDGNELIEVERILGIRLDSATVGRLNGEITTQGDPNRDGKDKPQDPNAADKDKKPKSTDLAQALRETLFGNKPLSQVTQDFAVKIAEWMPEMNWNGMFMTGIYPNCSKEELLAAWDDYHMTMMANRPKVSQLCGIPVEQIIPIELLTNAVAEKSGNLSEKIAHYFGPGIISDDHATEILGHMGLDRKSVLARRAAADKAKMAKDPSAGLQQSAEQQFADPARSLFEMVAALRAPLDVLQLSIIGATHVAWKDRKIDNAPVVNNDTTASVEENPPRSFKGYYRKQYGIDPAKQIAEVLKSHFQHGKAGNSLTLQDAAKLTQIDPGLLGSVTPPPPSEELVIDGRNQHLVRPGFTKETAVNVAQQMWDGIHGDGKIYLVLNQLYASNTNEEQRLIRMAFRQISSGIDLQFYIQQAKLQKAGAPVTAIGQQGTDKDANAADNKKHDIAIDGDQNKLDTALALAQTGTLDAHAQLKSVIGTGSRGQMDQVFKIVDEAPDDQRKLILADEPLMNRMHGFCDAYAWNRVYKTLTGQSDLTDRLYSRAHGAYDSWSPFDCTDEEGMKEDIKDYVKRLKKQYQKEVREAPDAKGQDSAVLEKLVKAKVENACQRLMANPQVRAIIEDEMSGDDLAITEGLILHGGEKQSEDDVTRDGASFDTIIATLRDTPAEKRKELLNNAGYMERLGERIHNASHYQQIIDLLKSGTNDDHLGKLDDAIRDEKSKEIMRNLVELDEGQLAQVQADLKRQTLILSIVTDPGQRTLVRRILNVAETKVDQTKDGKPDQQQAEKARLARLVESATQKLMYVEAVKLGWDTLLAKAIEVYQLDFETVPSKEPTGNEGDDPAKAATEGKADKAKHDFEAQLARGQVWTNVKDDIAASAKRIDADKTRTTKSKVNEQKINTIVAQAVMKQHDPSSERLSEQMGDKFNVETVDGPIEVQQKTDQEGIKKTIAAASPEVLIAEWSSVTKRPMHNGLTLKETFDEYTVAKKAHAAEMKTASDKEDPDKVRQRDEKLLSAKMGFVNYTIVESAWFEQKLLSDVNMGDAEDRIASSLGGIQKLGTRDNKKYNEALDALRDRLKTITQGTGGELIATAIGITEKEDKDLLDTPNRVALTAGAYRNEKYLRERGSQAGSGWAANAEGQRVDNALAVYNHDKTQAQVEGTDPSMQKEGEPAPMGKDGKPLERGMISEEKGKELEEEGGDVDKALQAFKDKKARVAQWMSTIIGVLVTVILTVATGGLAAGPLAALFWTTAIAGMSALAKATVNKVVLENDYSFKEEGIHMILSEMGTALITGGTTMLASKVMGVAGGAGRFLTQQGKAVGAVLRTPPPTWAKYLGEFGEASLQDALGGGIDAGLTAIDPVYWMHGIEEGRDRAYPAAMEKLRAVPDHAVRMGLQTFLVNRVMSIGGKKEELQQSMAPELKAGTVHFKANVAKVFGSQKNAVMNSMFEFALKNRGPDAGKIDWDEAPADLVNSYLSAVNAGAWEIHSETGFAGSHETKIKEDLAANEHLFANENEKQDFEKMQEGREKAPYVSVRDYVQVRRGLVMDALANHKGAELSPIQMQTFIAWCRESPTAQEFQRRLNVAPDSPEIRGVTPKPEAKPPGVDEAANANATATPSNENHGDKHEAVAKTNAKQDGKQPPAEQKPAFEKLATVPKDTGLDLIKRLSAGDATALEQINGKKGALEDVVYGLGKMPDGTFVIVKGTKHGVDFSEIPGCVGIAHSTPVTEAKGAGLKGADKGGIEVGKLMSNSTDPAELRKIMPNVEDLASGDTRIVMTPFVSLGEGKIGNPADAKAGNLDQHVQLVVRRGREVGRSALEPTAKAYAAEVVMRANDGTPLWQGTIYMVELKGGTVTSFDPKLIEVGKMAKTPDEVAAELKAKQPEVAQPEGKHPADKEPAAKEPVAKEPTNEAAPERTRTGGKDRGVTNESLEAKAAEELGRPLNEEDKHALESLRKVYSPEEALSLFKTWKVSHPSKMPTAAEQAKLGHAGIDVHNHFMGNVSAESFRDRLADANGHKLKDGQVSEWEPLLEKVLTETKKHKYKEQQGGGLETDPETGKPVIADKGRLPTGDANFQAVQAKELINEQKAIFNDPDASPTERAKARAEIERLAKSAVEKALSASDETDFNSAYRVRDALVKDFYGEADRKKLGIDDNTPMPEQLAKYREHFKGRKAVLEKITAAEQAVTEFNKLARPNKKQRQTLDDALAAVKEQLAYDAYAKDTVIRLAKDNIKYSEQSSGHEKLKSMFDSEQIEWIKSQLVPELIANGQPELAKQVRDLTIVHLAMIGTKNFGGASEGVSYDDKTVKPEQATEAEFKKEMQAAVELTARGDVAGVDIGGSEHFDFNKMGADRFVELGSALAEAAAKPGAKKPLVLRPHVGEGANDVANGKHFSNHADRQAKGDKGTGAVRAEHNIDVLIQAVEALQQKYDGKDGRPKLSDLVTIRFGHVTNANPEQAAKLAKLGIIAEVNLESNAKTGAASEKPIDAKTDTTPAPLHGEGPAPTNDAHSLPELIYAGAQIILSTDGHEVMGTTMQNEYARAGTIAGEVATGARSVRLTHEQCVELGINVPDGQGKSVTLNEVPEGSRDKFRKKFEDAAAKFFADANKYYNEQRPTQGQPERDLSGGNDPTRTGASNGEIGGDNQQTMRPPENPAELNARVSQLATKLSPEHRVEWDRITKLAENPGQRALMDRALAANHSLEEINQLRMAMTGMSDAVAMRELSGFGVVQLYEQSCVPAAYQIALAEIDPVFALKLRNNPEMVLLAQRDAVRAGGGKPTERSDVASGENVPINVQDQVNDGLLKGPLADKANFGSTDPNASARGITTESMVGGELHKELEARAGASYGVRHRAGENQKVGPGEFATGAFPHEEVVAALDQHRPVLVSISGHEYVLTRHTENGYVYTDPDTGASGVMPTVIFNGNRVDNVTMPEGVTSHGPDVAAQPNPSNQGERAEVRTGARPVATGDTKKDGIVGGKTTFEDFRDGFSSPEEIAKAKQSMRSDNAMTLEQMEASMAGQARSEQEMLAAVQNGEMPRYLARVGDHDSMGTNFGSKWRQFIFAAEPADLRGLPPIEALLKVGWTMEWIKKMTYKRDPTDPRKFTDERKDATISVCIFDVTADAGASANKAKTTAGKMEWAELSAKAMSDSEFVGQAEAKGVDEAELPKVFDVLKKTPVHAEPNTDDPALAAKCKEVRKLIDAKYGANDLYTGMGATLRPDGKLGAREVMLQANGTEFGLNGENHKLVTIGVITAAMVDAL